MCHLLKALLMASFVLGCPYTCMSMDWMGITPLRSTQTEVEKSLGKGKLIYGNTFEHKSDLYRVSIAYSLGKCGEHVDAKWDVSAGKVLFIVVQPRKKIFLEDIFKDMTNFEKLPGDFDLPGTFYFLNEAEGVSAEAQTTATTNRTLVTTLFFFPSAKERHLKC